MFMEFINLKCKLIPTILRDSQKYISENFSTPEDNPLAAFVFHMFAHIEHIREAISMGLLQ